MTILFPRQHRLSRILLRTALGFACIAAIGAHSLANDVPPATPAPVAAPAPAAVAKTFKPALLYLSTAKKGDKGDGAFIDSARIGAAKARHEYGIDIAEYQVTNVGDTANALKRAADSGASPIIALGSQNVAAVLTMAERYPTTQFAVVDGLVPPIFPNVQSILFRDNEGAFLVGVIAAKMSKSGRIGFIGGVDNPLIRNFATGYTQGAKYAYPKVEVTVDMIGSTPDAWNNPDKARELAIAQYNAGVEVIFAAAGGSSLGVLNAANQTHKYAIGVDINQNGLYPGRVLTSLVKRVDVAVYDTLKHSHDGSWNPGIKYLGIKEGALDYAVDQNNRALISEDLIEDVATAKDKIVNGLITVDTYSPK